MAAEAPLPPLLPTPPRSEMLPILPTPPKSMMLLLLPTPHGLVLTMQASAMPGRADFFQRWDWNKKFEKPCSCSVCSSSSSSEGSGSADRADSVDRWDSHKKYKKPRTTMSSSSSSLSSHGAGSPGRADSVERWDSKKLETSRSASQPTDRGRQDGGNNKRLPSPSRASSAERWDLHKKPRPEQMEKLPQANAAATTLATTPQKAVFAGASFYASPEPSMLPMPSFFLLARSRALCT